MFRALNKLNNLKKLHKLCKITYAKHQRSVIKLQREFSTSGFNTAKVFVDRENAYCYGIIEPRLATKNVFPTVNVSSEHQNKDWFNKILSHNFRQSTPTEIVATFVRVVPYCAKHNIGLSDRRFDALVNGLMDNAEKLNDAELLRMLDVLIEFPHESIRDHNFHDVWSCLDDMCVIRIGRWNEEMLFKVAEKWYKLNLGRVCDFLFDAVDKMSKKPEVRLSKDQLVQVFFLMNISRRSNVHFEYEHALYKKVHEMNVDELAIVALGYFKCQTKVKIPQILSEMLRKAKAAPDIHEMTLCAILKTVRYTSHPTLADQMLDFLEYITPKLETFSTLAILHTALLGTTLQILHKPSLKIAAQRIASNIADPAEVRLKDIERLLLALTMLDYDPQTTPCIFQAAMEELHQPRRELEIIRYRKCLGCALSYLAIKNIYSIELMTRVLGPDYISDVYGKSAKMFPRELFVLNMNAQIEVPDYRGPRLGPLKQVKVAKWLTAFTPEKNSGRKHTAIEKLILDVHEVVAGIVGGPERMFVEHLLPQYMRADVVICRDKLTGQFVKPQGFEHYQFGEIWHAPDKPDMDHFAIVIIGWNSTIRGTSHPVGLVHMKMRHLSKIGYKPFLVIWNQFAPLKSEEKVKYIENKIHLLI